MFYQELTAWLKAPFDTQQPLWKLFLVFIIFVVIGFVVVDNLDLLKKGIQV